MPRIIIDILIVIGYCFLVMQVQKLFAMITGWILGPAKGFHALAHLQFEMMYLQKGGYFGMGARYIVPTTLGGFVTMQGINYFYEVSWFMVGLAIFIHILFGRAEEANVGNKMMSYGTAVGLIIFLIPKILMIQVN